MYHVNVHAKMRIFNIFNQLKHIPSKALVAQCVQPFMLHIQFKKCPCCLVDFRGQGPYNRDKMWRGKRVGLTGGHEDETLDWGTNYA